MFSPPGGESHAVERQLELPPVIAAPVKLSCCTSLRGVGRIHRHVHRRNHLAVERVSEDDRERTAIGTDHGDVAAQARQALRAVFTWAAVGQQARRVIDRRGAVAVERQRDSAVRIGADRRNHRDRLHGIRQAVEHRLGPQRVGGGNRRRSIDDAQRRQVRVRQIADERDAIFRRVRAPAASA